MTKEAKKQFIKWGIAIAILTLIFITILQLGQTSFYINKKIDIPNIEIYKKASIVLNGKPEACDSFSDKQQCKKDLSAIYQDVDREDKCEEKEIESNDEINIYPDANCIISKAIKYKSPELCFDQYVDEKDFEGFAPLLFKQYFGYGGYSKIIGEEMSYKDACLTIVAYQRGEVGICNQIRYEKEKEMCKYFISQKN